MFRASGSQTLTKDSRGKEKLSDSGDVLDARSQWEKRATSSGNSGPDKRLSTINPARASMSFATSPISANQKPGMSDAEIEV